MERDRIQTMARVFLESDSAKIARLFRDPASPDSFPYISTNKYQIGDLFECIQKDLGIYGLKQKKFLDIGAGALVIPTIIH